MLLGSKVLLVFIVGFGFAFFFFLAELLTSLQTRHDMPCS